MHAYINTVSYSPSLLNSLPIFTAARNTAPKASKLQKTTPVALYPRRHATTVPALVILGGFSCWFEFRVGS